MDRESARSGGMSERNRSPWRIVENLKGQTGLVSQLLEFELEQLDP